VRSLGAEWVIDYTREDFTKTGRAYDVILDAVGKPSFRRSRASLNPDGIFLPTDGLANPEYRPIIDRRYRLEDVIEATRYVETEQKTGNVVLTVSR
jgi:NADPH:quinone reductase-like Zn-dependent oxidoreductase